MDLNISDTWVASEAHTRTTRTQTHARSSSCPHTCARMQRWSVRMGDPNMRREILTSLHRHTTLFARISTDLRSLHACSAPPYTHTRKHARVRVRARWRRRYGYVCTYNVEKVYACVRWTLRCLDVERARWHSSTCAYPSAIHPYTPLHP